MTIPLYKYVTIDTLKHILSDGIRFTQPSAFNDPFELLPELCVSSTEAEKIISIGFDINAKRRIPPVGEIGTTPDGYNCSDIISRKIVGQLNKSIGILCLSKNGESLLMWAHYAANYTGAIIEFDGAHEFFNGHFEVEYRESRPTKDITAYLLDCKPVPISELCVKPEQWSYEDEVRVVRKLANCDDTGKFDGKYPIWVMKVPTGCIREITFGERTRVEDQRTIWDAIKDSNIRLSLAAVANWKYEFRRELIKFNVPLSQSAPVISPRTAHIFSHLPSALGDVARLLIDQHGMSEFVNTTV